MATAGPNTETTEAWDGPLFDRFLEFRHLIVDSLGLHGAEALTLFPPAPGEHVVDVGCGFGDTTQAIAALVGPGGSVTGVDVAARFVEAARAEAADAGVANARFIAADVQTDDLGGPYDLAFSRFGTMFFENPVAAMRNVRRSLRPGGRLVMVVWRDRTENEWLHRPQQITEAIVQRPTEYDEPTCGPGPFSMAGADTTSGILVSAGFRDISLRRSDLPVLVGRDIAEAVEFAMALGPAAEILRLQGDRAADRTDEVRAALAGGIAEFETEGGVFAPSSTWIVSATSSG